MKFKKSLAFLLALLMLATLLPVAVAADEETMLADVIEDVDGSANVDPGAIPAANDAAAVINDAAAADDATDLIGAADTAIGTADNAIDDADTAIGAAAAAFGAPAEGGNAATGVYADVDAINNASLTGAVTTNTDAAASAVAAMAAAVDTADDAIGEADTAIDSAVTEIGTAGTQIAAAQTALTEAEVLLTAAQAKEAEVAADVVAAKADAEEAKTDAAAKAEAAASAADTAAAAAAAADAAAAAAAQAEDVKAAEAAAAVAAQAAETAAAAAEAAAAAKDAADARVAEAQKAYDDALARVKEIEAELGIDENGDVTAEKLEAALDAAKAAYDAAEAAASDAETAAEKAQAAYDALNAAQANAASAAEAAAAAAEAAALLQKDPDKEAKVLGTAAMYNIAIVTLFEETKPGPAAETEIKGFVSADKYYKTDPQCHEIKEAGTLISGSDVAANGKYHGVGADGSNIGPEDIKNNNGVLSIKKGGPGNEYPLTWDSAKGQWYYEVDGSKTYIYVFSEIKDPEAAKYQTNVFTNAVNALNQTDVNALITDTAAAAAAVGIPGTRAAGTGAVGAYEAALNAAAEANQAASSAKAKAENAKAAAEAAKAAAQKAFDDYNKLVLLSADVLKIAEAKAAAEKAAAEAAAAQAEAEAQAAAAAKAEAEAKAAAEALKAAEKAQGVGAPAQTLQKPSVIAKALLGEAYSKEINAAASKMTAKAFVIYVFKKAGKTVNLDGDTAEKLIKANGTELDGCAADALIVVLKDDGSVDTFGVGISDSEYIFFNEATGKVEKVSADGVSLAAISVK